MKTNAPKFITLVIAVILAVVGLVGLLVPALHLGCCAAWLVVAGFVVLLAGNLLKGL
ncbi:MAG: hypothetical protein LBS01_05865 [Prevotellaceae bacterium]|jgi:hypothetical protein|nr:hypothetical protein [Prevotellaceae bacterium]